MKSRGTFMSYGPNARYPKSKAEKWLDQQAARRRKAEERALIVREKEKSRCEDIEKRAKVERPLVGFQAPSPLTQPDVQEHGEPNDLGSMSKEGNGLDQRGVSLKTKKEDCSFLDDVQSQQDKESRAKANQGHENISTTATNSRNLPLKTSLTNSVAEMNNTKNNNQNQKRKAHNPNFIPRKPAITQPTRPNNILRTTTTSPPNKDAYGFSTDSYRPRCPIPWECVYCRVNMSELEWSRAEEWTRLLTEGEEPAWALLEGTRSRYRG